MKKPVFVLCILIVFASSSFTMVSKIEPTIVFSDTTFTASSSPALEKRTGFFGRVKNKLLAVVVKRQAGEEQMADKKSKLGWAAVGLIVLGGGLFLLTGNLLTVLPAIAGLVVGIKAASIKRERPVVKKEKKEKRDSWASRHIGLLIGLGLVVGAVVAVAIIGANIGFR